MSVAETHRRLNSLLLFMKGSAVIVQQFTGDSSLRVFECQLFLKLNLCHFRHSGAPLRKLYQEI